MSNRKRKIINKFSINAIMRTLICFYSVLLYIVLILTIEIVIIITIIITTVNYLIFIHLDRENPLIILLEECQGLIKRLRY